MTKNIIQLAIIRQKYRIDGGGEKIILSILQGLNTYKIQPHIITRYWPKNIQHIKYNVHICNPFIWNRISREKQFSKTAMEYCEKKFNIIQSHERIPHCDIFRAGDGVHQAWLTQRNRVLPRHQQWYQNINNYHQYILQTEQKMFDSPKLKIIICNSHMVKKDIINFYNIKPNKIKIIHNSVDSKKFFPANNTQYYQAKKKLQIPQQSCTLIYVGSGFERKGLQRAIYAISLTNRYLIIVGYDKYIKRYQTLSKELGCFHRTRFIGISNNLLPYYHAADALILPTLYDPFPNAILEAMSCALPIITTWQCGSSELIKTGQEGFICDALDINNLQKFVLEIPLKNKYPYMGLAARKKIINLNNNILTKKLITLYTNIINHTI
ncbi:glycosyltransferase family 4 protein [Blochmannia endosymbiont of Polyrhachis (Hedomyrma) turneri]|uniref:glycosyltransferase family 4 protein n=1 Tax=Blochmannia endosymbiont of Polyrhachis (Hedomyrma) turneri TaxID=1505596 RepID=UPI00061A68C5|nr:glycosyltransferase family 4 protein [Blochmannia endosymbiont of Polyrhachis (Hedomyrma) turneri]AKC60162.1 putative glycosyltransferase [Blochmannia endosymbiont of Polyrhachis (Hedomyrma) turneri]